MADTRREERRSQIEAAAFEVLEEMGYRKASMLQIAKRAQASNETLYAWYGSKQKLFRAIIEENAKALKVAVAETIGGEVDPKRSLERFGCLLLKFTATEKAIIFNRAAIADVADTGVLARAIEESARSVILGLLATLLVALERTGHYRFNDRGTEAAEVFVSLLLGELQMQQALGTIPALT
ncbi:MAG: TetR/AcrR family transcriptional regulator, partial [Pseudomonadota bacterium]